MKIPNAMIKQMTGFVKIFGVLSLVWECRHLLSSLPSNVPYVSARRSTAGVFMASAVAIRGVSSDMYVLSGSEIRGCMSGCVSSRRK